VPDGELDLLVVADSAGGGLGAAARAHAQWFARQGWRVGLVAPGVDQVDTDATEVLYAPELAGAFHVGPLLRSAGSLRKQLRQRRPTVVHAHGTRSQLLCLLAGCRPYVTMHGSGGRIEGQHALGAAVRAVARRVAARLSVRAYSAAPAGGGWETLLHASPRLAEFDRMLPASDKVPVFLWVGRLDAPKRPDLFVDACARAGRTANLRAVMLGDGPLLGSIRAQAADLGAPVEVLGPTDDVMSYLREASAVCLFSDFEGVPFSVQEAMWAGRAVVLSPLPSLQWFAGEAATYADDPAAAAEALLALCDRDVATARGVLAAERVREMLSADAPFSRLLSDYGARQ
jgi:glycosyltransferase involved in cell wall biosynthesis